MKTTTTPSADGTFTVMVQHCGQGLLTTTVDDQAKSTDQGKKTVNMLMKETVWEL